MHIGIGGWLLGHVTIMPMYGPMPGLASRAAVSHRLTVGATPATLSGSTAALRTLQLRARPSSPAASANRYCVAVQ